MKKPVFVWRESVYKNDFRCNKCKKKVADKDGMPIDECLCAVDYPAVDMNTLVCPDCHSKLAIMSNIDAPLDGGFYGRMRDFMRTLNLKDGFDKKESDE